MHIEHFYDPQTNTFSYVVVDTITNKCAVIDSVLDYDPYAVRTSTKNADKIIDYITSHNLTNEWLLETHIHADHITAASYLQPKIGGKIALGSGIKDVLAVWVPKLDKIGEIPTDGSQFNKLFDDGEQFTIGSLSVTVWHTAGHTPACACYLVNDAIFVGDTIFAPHLGTARCDFPGGNAVQMYQTIQKIYSLPDETRIFLCHDYPEPDQQPQYLTTVGVQKRENIMIKSDTSQADYIKRRTERDKTLAVPKLIYPSLQANMLSGDFGKVHENGFKYLMIPVNGM